MWAGLGALATLSSVHKRGSNPRRSTIIPLSKQKRNRKVIGIL